MQVSFYDINIDFDIEEKSLDELVTIKAESIRDLNKLQIDLAENLIIKKITYENQKLSYSKEFDAVLIEFISAKGSIFGCIFYQGIPQSADNPPWAGGFTWSKDKEGRDWIAVSCRGRCKNMLA